MSAMPQPSLVDWEIVKTDLYETWTAGNYDVFSRFMVRNAEQLVKRLELAPGTRLVDVACGSGQIGIIAAREGALVAGCDIAPASIGVANARARIEHLCCHFVEGDAEELPYDSATFDVVVSVYGAMFAPRPDLAAREMVRVCRPGGRIVMANWTPQGFVGELARTCAAFFAPAGVPSPLLWGDEEVARRRFAHAVQEVRVARYLCPLEYPATPDRVVEFYRYYYGPTFRMFDALDPAGRAELRGELVDLWTRWNRSNDPGRTIVDAEYLEVTAVR